MHGDPIADMLTRIRNAAATGKTHVFVRATGVCQGIAGVLREEGYIADFDRIETAVKQDLLRIALKYAKDGSSVINEIKRESKPGRRIYSPARSMPVVLNGMGVVIVSTSRGVMTDRKCRQENIGGEILCTVN